MGRHQAERPIPDLFSNDRVRDASPPQSKPNTTKATTDTAPAYPAKGPAANTARVFEFARQLSAAKSSSDLFELWTAHAQKQTAMLNEQIKELTALGKKFACESAAPFTRSVNQAFKEAS